MAKQQTLTIIVNDEMADPAELVESALERFLSAGPLYPEYGDEPAEMFDRPDDYGTYMILEED